MEKKSLEQIARVKINDVACEPKISPILHKIKTYEPTLFIHSTNVAFIATQVGMQRGFFGERLKDLTRGALLHDCGKTFISVDLLTKPNYLTEREYDLLKEHPKMGYEFLLDKGFSETVLDIVKHHHERMDGSGYPDGLMGNQIIEETQIVMAIDAWDAMTSERPYKKPMEGEYVYDFLINSEIYSRNVLRLLRMCTDA